MGEDGVQQRRVDRTGHPHPRPAQREFTSEPVLLLGDEDEDDQRGAPPAR
ncbi:MAG TPA: hypothetical protein PK880_06705 [Candidatus Competibacter sp.]|nr:hypothetical protein [Candidatus Competibacter sp.]